MSPVDPDDDAAWMALVAQGDDAALAHIYKRHSRVVFAVAMKLLRHRGEAEDLLHDVFMEAWRHAHRFDASRGSVRTWLLVRCRARAIDRLRSPRLKRRRSLEGLPERSSAALSAERQSDGQRVREALATLPQVQRAVVEAACFRGLTSVEIAEEQGIAVGTVKSRTAAAMRKLRRVLSAEPVEAA